MNVQKRKCNKKQIVILLIISCFVIFKIGIACSNWNYSNIEPKISAYNEAVYNYNLVADEYEKIKLITSLENIDGLPKSIIRRDPITFIDFIKSILLQESLILDTSDIINNTNELLYALILAQQITNPNEEWVKERLKLVDDITIVQSVTKNHDPNQLLGIEGGYTSCIYFSVKQISDNLINENNIIEKGTDAGGAIEIYSNINDAQSRCDYLGQFDNTLLYSGSYALLGTMVIRTSYQLTNEQQLDLTNKVTTVFTALE